MWFQKQKKMEQNCPLCKQNIFDKSNQSNSIPWLLYLDESEKIIENLQHMLNNIRNNIHGTSVKKYKFFSD